VDSLFGGIASIACIPLVARRTYFLVIADDQEQEEMIPYQEG
jgi:hypothetical protein